jgi:ribonuclease T1
VRTLLAFIVAGVALFAPVAGARDVPPPTLAEIGVDELPAEARHTLALIKRGGPFPYSKDGTTFGNREKQLPRQPRGYYTEYTVKTPHSRDRGPRRIVAGRGDARDPATSGEYYYTDDHYASFRRIRE